MLHKHSQPSDRFRENYRKWSSEKPVNFEAVCQHREGLSVLPLSEPVTMTIKTVRDGETEHIRGHFITST